MPEYSDQPGFHERHLQRRENNPLFPISRQSISQQDIHTAQRQDREAFSEFMSRFTAVVDRATKLDSNVDSQVILDLKQDLDKCYEECAGLAGDQDEFQTAIGQLIETIMQAIWKGADQDPQAQEKLRDEETARSLHFQLLKTPLVADLLNPQTPIAQEELIPTLLSAEADTLTNALQIFQTEHLASLCRDASDLLTKLENDGIDTAYARDRLQQMKTFTTQSAETESIN